MRLLHSTRIRLAVFLPLLLIGGGNSARAQFLDALKVQHASGDLSAGYNGQYGSNQSSSHDMGLGGDASINGSYYNPSFLAFNATTYYNRAQSEAGSTSLETSKGYSLSSQIFGGSAIPGNASFSQSWGNSGTYGLPGLSGLNSYSDTRSLSIGWVFRRLPIVKNLSVSYGNSQASTTIPGLGSDSETKNQTFGVSSSGYRLAGFSLGLGYQHWNINSSGSILNSESNSVSTSTSMNMYHASTGRTLPWNIGSFTLSAYRTTSGSSLSGESSTSATDEVNGMVSTRVWRLPVSVNVDYNDNVYAAVLQELNASGQTVGVNSNSPRTGYLTTTLSTSYGLPYSIFTTGYVTHEQEFVGGQTLSDTSAGVNASYAFGRILKGLSILIGTHDSATQAGNQGAGLIATATYTNHFGGWQTSSNISYNQNVQTMLAMYTTSTMSAMASARRDLYKGIKFSINAGYGRSVFQQQAGSGGHSENTGFSLAWLRQTLSGAYSQSDGSGIVTNQGVVSVTTPGLVTNTEEYFTGRTYTAGYSNSIVKHLNVGIGWSKSTTSNTGVGSQTSALNVSSEQYNGYLLYTFRKLNFTASATKSFQGANSGTLPSNQTVYYFGVSRWFNFF